MVKEYVSGYKNLFAALDQNRDGKISFLEMIKQAPHLTVYFQYIDENRDGFITFKEMLASRVVIVQNTRKKDFLSGGPESFNEIENNSQFDISSPTFSSAESERTSDARDQGEPLIEREQQLLKNFFNTSQQKDGTEPPQHMDPIVVVAGPDEDDDAGFGMATVYVGGGGMGGATSLTQGQLCRAGCWALGSAVCAAVGVSCVIGTVITVRGLSIPCTYVIIATCAASGGGASVCSDVCPP